MNIFEQLKEKGYIIFFNEGYYYTEKFIMRPTRGPNFFWYHDSYFSHISIEKNDRYLHIFIKKKEDYDFYFMQRNETWEDVHNHYLRNKEELSKTKEIKRLIGYNPPILRSSDTLIPDLIFDFEKEGNKESVCIFPDKYKGIRCKFFDDNHKPIDFIDIPELMKIINNIVE